MRPPGHGRADAAHPNNPQGAALEPKSLAVFLFPPAPVAQVEKRVRNTPIRGNEQTDGQFCDGVGVLSRTVGDVDAFFAGFLDVDGVDARASANDQRQCIAGLDGGSRDLG